MKKTWKKLENGKVGPALNCKLMDMIGVTRLSIYPDWMHDKNLGTDKATRAHTFLQIVLYTQLQQGWGSFCLTVVWMRGGARVAHFLLQIVSHSSTAGMGKLVLQWSG